MSLIYWYFLLDAVERGEGFRFPEMVRRSYVAKAFGMLAQGAKVGSRDVPRAPVVEVTRDVAGGVAEMLGRLEGYERQQRDVKRRMREEDEGGGRGWCGGGDRDGAEGDEA